MRASFSSSRNNQRCQTASRTRPGEGVVPCTPVSRMSGRGVGEGIVGVPTVPTDPGADPQFPELCDTTRGLPPSAGDVISTLWLQTPVPDQVDTIV